VIVSRIVVRLFLPALAIGLVSMAAWQIGAGFATSAHGQELQASSPDLVTVADVNAAVVQTIACLNERGITASVQEGSGLRPTRFSYQAGADADTVRQTNENVADCAVQMQQVQEQWSQQKEQPTAEEFRALVARITECVDTGAQGTTLSSPVTVLSGPYDADPSFILALREDQLEAFANCSQAEEAATGLYALPYEVR
jgi:hypothetical protein